MAGALAPRTPPEPATAEEARGQWWRCLFEASEDAQIVCRTDGAVLELNQRARQLFGLPDTPKLPGYLLASLLTPTTVRKLTQLLARTAGRQETLPAVSLLCRGQLSLVADLQVTPLGDGCSLVTMRDASRRWRMESHVQRLITAVNSTSDVVYLTDAEFRLTFVNSAFQQVTGHSIEDALGRETDLLRAPSEAAKVAAYRGAVTRGQDWRGEVLNLRRDGTTYPVEAAISPIYDKQGLLLGCVSFERDISAQKRLQHELALERDYTQSIIHSLDAAVFSLDRELRLRHVNRVWEAFPPGYGWLSFPAPPSLGGPFLDCIPDPARRAEVREVLHRVLAEGQPHELRGSLEPNRQWLVKITPWKHGPEVIGLNYLVVDQTRFCELQTQLFQAQKMETIGALAAGVAHDFNNLLLAIRGNVSLVQLEEGLSTVVRDKLAQIDQAAGRAAGITQQLLSFSRSTEEKEVVLDFNQLVREASQLARRTLKNKITIQLDLPEAPIKVCLDSTRGSQVLLNLAVNAHDAMPKGGTLTLRNRLVRLTAAQAQRARRPVGDEFLCCSITDTGTGIPPEVLPRIFDPFFTTKATGKGTGLGLAIVHSVVTGVGGFIEIETKVGEGTSFHIFLPTVTTGLTEPPRRAAAGLVRGAGRVLVVDDMDFILEFTQSFLQAAGY